VPSLAELRKIPAAAHDGKPPKSLDELTVPVPLDPFTGKPFGHELIGNIAVLTSTPPAGMEANPSQMRAYNLRYEVTVRK
jgi:hypothetical protein